MRKGGYTKTYKGKFTPKNYDKYKGKHTEIFYRSTWERVFMTYCDMNKNIIEWSSEEIVIPYISPKDRRKHLYFPDFWIKTRHRNGDIQKMVIEVKPQRKVEKPVISEERLNNQRTRKKEMDKYIEWMVNQAKWEAAEKHCTKCGWIFKIMTEKDLGLIK